MRPGVNTQTVTLLMDGEVYGERLNSFDVRFATILSFGNTRSNIGIDV